jgi:hypothetical protein
MRQVDWGQFQFLKSGSTSLLLKCAASIGLGNKMKKTSLIALVLATTACPVLAKPHRVGLQQNSLGTHSSINCAMVRSYVAQVGLEQAKAMAEAAGMSAAEEARARRCLSHKAQA